MKRAAGGQSVKSFQLISASIYHPHSVVFKWTSAGVLMTVFHDCSCIISQWQKSGNYIFTPPPPPINFAFFSRQRTVERAFRFTAYTRRHAKERWYEQLIWLRYSCWFNHSFLHVHLTLYSSLFFLFLSHTRTYSRRNAKEELLYHFIRVKHLLNPTLTAKIFVQGPFESLTKWKTIMMIIILKRFWTLTILPLFNKAWMLVSTKGLKKDFLYHNSDFSHKCEFLFHNSDFFAILRKNS